MQMYSSPQSDFGNTPPNNQTPPDNYLVWAILSTLFCCLPLGVVSIIKSSEVNSKWIGGDHEGARRSSEAAKKFAIYSAIAAPVVFLIYLFAMGGLTALSAMMGQ